MAILESKTQREIVKKLKIERDQWVKERGCERERELEGWKKGRERQGEKEREKERDKELKKGRER